MARLFSDLIDGSNRRYFFGLNAATGGIQPSPGALTVSGLAPTILIQSQVFRSPAPAVITLQAPSLSLRVPMQPAPAVITQAGSAANLLKQRVITNAVSADYTDPVSFAPTIAFIQTITPAPALITINGLEFSLTQGGDIGFITPITGLISLVQNLTPTAIFFESTASLVTVTGFAPTLLTSVTVEPLPAIITVQGYETVSELGFVWIDVPPPPPLTWTTTTGISS